MCLLHNACACCACVCGPIDIPGKDGHGLTQRHAWYLFYSFLCVAFCGLGPAAFFSKPARPGEFVEEHSLGLTCGHSPIPFPLWDSTDHSRQCEENSHGNRTPPWLYSSRWEEQGRQGGGRGTFNLLQEQEEEGTRTCFSCSFLQKQALSSETCCVTFQTNRQTAPFLKQPSI